MNNFPIDKYRFYSAGNKIIAVSTYAGKTIRGVAICHPDDKFDFETGKRLAAARCNEKVALKRFYRASEKYQNALDELEMAKAKATKMREYYNDAAIAIQEAGMQTDAIMVKISGK